MPSTLLSLIARLWARPQHTIATVDYYFEGAMSDLIRNPGEEDLSRPIIRLGPHTFAHHDRLVIIRYLTDAELSAVRRQRWERVLYVIDDVLPLVQQCTELPDYYRQRLMRFVTERLPEILALKPVIVAPRETILDLFPGFEGHRLDPAALFVAQDLDHFAEALSGEAPFRIGFLGTRSHAAGVDFLVPVLERVLAAREDVRFVHFLGSSLPLSLRRLRSVESREFLPWPRYKALLQRERFHALLAPVPDTLFNQGRSLTKFLDAAAIGAAGLFSDRAPFTSVVRTNVNGLLLPDDPERWTEELLRLAGDPAAAQELAAAGARDSRRIGDPTRVRAFWTTQLGL